MKSALLDLNQGVSENNMRLDSALEAIFILTHALKILMPILTASKAISHA